MRTEPDAGHRIERTVEMIQNHYNDWWCVHCTSPYGFPSEFTKEGLQAARSATAWAVGDYCTFTTERGLVVRSGVCENRV
eukprot:3750546-Prymnesium_polylepis.1